MHTKKILGFFFFLFGRPRRLCSSFSFLPFFYACTTFIFILFEFCWCIMWRRQVLKWNFWVERRPGGWCGLQDKLIEYVGRKMLKSVVRTEKSIDTTLNFWNSRKILERNSFFLIKSILFRQRQTSKRSIAPKLIFDNSLFP